MYIEVENLSRRYGEVLALNQISLKLNKGTVGLLGPNGAGKSTFLKIVSGLLEPTDGTVKILGEVMTNKNPEIKNHIGIMPEYPCLIRNLNAVEFVMYMGMLSGMDKNTALTRSHEVLDYCRIGEERYRKIGEYSFGMMQKVKLAQSLVHDPEILLFDEPVAGVDPMSREEILSLIKELRSLDNKLIVFSTHILEDVEEICNEVILINRGKIVLSGKMDEILRAETEFIRFRVGERINILYEHLKKYYKTKVFGNEIRVYTTNEEVIDYVMKICSENNVEIRCVEKGVRTLEDVFLIAVRGKELAL